MASLGNVGSGSGSGLDLSQLTDNDKKELQQFIQNESQKSNIQDTVHQLSAMCFKKCITGNIRDGKLDKYEEPCIQNCVGRFMDANMTIIKHLEQMRTS